MAQFLEAQALSCFMRDEVLVTLHREGFADVPLLIAGITPHTGRQDLELWSAGAVQGCRTAESFAGNYVVGKEIEITRQLAEQNIPSRAVPAGVIVSDTHATVPLLSFHADDRDYEVFVRVSANIFLIADMADTPPPSSLAHLRAAPAFSSAAPFICSFAMLREIAAGISRALLPISQSTIPGSTEPFGCLNYNDLLAEMDRHNFHTEIGFVPWNFDRSEPAIVNLFRSRSDRYSICFHGDDHKHQEFAGMTRFRWKPRSPASSALWCAWRS